MLYKVIDNQVVEWKGEPLNEVLHPLIIEYRWTNEELADVGLYRPQPLIEEVPEGKASIGQTLKFVDGVVRYVHTGFTDLVEPTVVLPALKPYQFWGMVKASGYEADLRATVANILDPTQKAFAEAMLEYSLEFRRDHPLVVTVQETLEMTTEELDMLWQAASTL